MPQEEYLTVIFESLDLINFKRLISNSKCLSNESKF